MRYLIHGFAVFVLTLWVSISVLAQVDGIPEPNVILPPVNDNPGPAKDDQKKSKQTKKLDDSVVHLCANHMDTWPEKLKRACQELLMEAIRANRQQFEAQTTAKYAMFRVEHMQATLRNQRREGAWVFWIVVAVVSIGLLAAIMQFLRAFGFSDSGGSLEVAISNNELKFKTTWLGALLLGMSMGFLVIYLFFVYPIRYVGG